MTGIDGKRRFRYLGIVFNGLNRFLINNIKRKERQAVSPVVVIDK